MIDGVTDSIRRIADANSQLLQAHDPDSVIAAFDAVPAAEAYHFVPAAVRERWAAVAREFGEPGFDALQKMTMLRLIDRFEARADGKRYTDRIRKSFDTSFRRILRSIENPAFAQYRTDNDLLRKDLAICRQQLFPAGAQVVEPYSGFHRSLVFRGGFYQGLRLLMLMAKTGGNSPYYQIHTHLGEMEDFNPDGWDQCYVRIAEMLEAHPEIKGMFGGSWFYDPALATVSPRLVYLRERPQRNGASVFYSGIDIHGGALAKSKSRQELYEKGQYLPKAYLVVWPRREMIAWAHRFLRRDHT